MSVLEKKKLRFKFLEHLYNTIDGDSRYSVSMWELGAELKIEREMISQIVQYLQDEYLVEPRGLGGTITISHAGILEIEEATLNPDKPTEHFLPINIINVGSMINSGIQQGSNHSNQYVEYKVEDRKVLEELLAILGLNIDNLQLNSEDRKELISEKETIESQIKSPKPKTIIIRESLKTIRSLMEGVASSLIATKVLDLIKNLL